jgi:N-acetylglucosamine-6-phosphate deacetylase
MQMANAFIVKGITLIDDGSEHPEAAVLVRDGRVRFAGSAGSITEEPDLPELVLPGWYITPGFLDLQINGAFGHDFTSDPESIPAVAARLPETGVTAFLPTFITSPLESYPGKLQAVEKAKLWFEEKRVSGEQPGARMLGAHLEGPFLNPESPGAHDSSLFALPTPEALAYYSPLEAVRLVTLAVERPGGTEAARWLMERGVSVSIGHSRATAEEAQQAFKAGVRTVTHLFNAMPPLNHRQPGLVGAVLNSSEARAGLIADGVHLHPLVLKLVYNSLGSRGLYLVTDAMAAMAMPPGEYKIGGKIVMVDSTRAVLPGGTLAGSILQMDVAVRNMVEFGVCSLPEAVRMASQTPAETLGLEGEMGRLLPGYPADMLLLDQALSLQAAFIGGRLAYANAYARNFFEQSGMIL